MWDWRRGGGHGGHGDGGRDDDFDTLTSPRP